MYFLQCIYLLVYGIDFFFWGGGNKLFYKNYINLLSQTFSYKQLLQQLHKYELRSLCYLLYFSHYFSLAASQTQICFGDGIYSTFYIFCSHYFYSWLFFCCLYPLNNLIFNPIICIC